MRPDIHDYDLYLVAFSGGKDSTACLLWLLDQGIDRSKIELHHHLVDGREGSNLMDWPCTEPYCTAVASAFGIPIYYSWKQGGFEREMMRLDSPTAPISWETPEGAIKTIGGTGPNGTRMKFPQVSPNLSVRWCSPYLKIDVFARMLNVDARFKGKRIIVLSGERAEESASRACYATFEPDRSDNRHSTRKRGGLPNQRHIDRIRPIHGWTEAQVWEIIQRHGVVAHPAYHLGWGRCSCRGCIFGNPNQFASLAKVDSEGFSRLASIESEFGCTIKRKDSLPVYASKGKPYPATSRQEMIERAMGSHPWATPIISTPDDWEMPAGAYGESAGPV